MDARFRIPGEAEFLRSSGVRHKSYRFTASSAGKGSSKTREWNPFPVFPLFAKDGDDASPFTGALQRRASVIFVPHLFALLLE